MLIASNSTGEITTSQVILDRPGNLSAVLIITDGTNPATVMLFDGMDANGKKLGEWSVPGASLYGGRNWTFPVQCKAGIYCTVSGTGASAIVEYI